MKQNITIDQLKELTQEQEAKLRDLWKPKQYNLVAYTYKYHEELETDRIIIKGLYNGNPTKIEEVSDMEGEYVFPKENCLPILNIGQMIELLKQNDKYDCIPSMKHQHYNGDNFIDVGICTKNNGHISTENFINNVECNELCDALWEVIKMIL